MTGNTQATAPHATRTGEPLPFDPRDETLSEFQALSFAGIAIVVAGAMVGYTAWRESYIAQVEQTVDAANEVVNQLDAVLA